MKLLKVFEWKDFDKQLKRDILSWFYDHISGDCFMSFYVGDLDFDGFESEGLEDYPEDPTENMCEQQRLIYNWLKAQGCNEHETVLIEINT